MNINPNRKKNLEKYNVGLNAFASLNAEGLSKDPRKNKANAINQQNVNNQRNPSFVEKPNPVPVPSINTANFGYSDRPITPSSGFSKHQFENSRYNEQRGVDRHNDATVFASLGTQSTSQRRSESKEPRGADRVGQVPGYSHNNAGKFFYNQPVTSNPSIYPPNFGDAANNCFSSFDKPAHVEKRRSTSTNRDTPPLKKSAYGDHSLENQQFQLEKIALEHENTGLKEENERLKQTANKYIVQARTNSDVLAKSLDEQRKKQEEYDNVASELQEVKTKLKAANIKIGEYQREVKHFKTEVRAKEADVASIQIRMDILRNEVRDAKIDYTKLNDKFKVSETDVKHLKRKLSEALAEKEKASNSAASEATRLNAEAEAELEKLRTQTSSDHKLIEKLQLENKTLVEDSKRMMDDFESQWKNYSEKHDQLNNTISEQNKQIKDMQDRCDELVQQLENKASSEDIDRLNAELKTANDERERLRQQKEGITATLRMYLEENQNLKNDLANQGNSGSMNSTVLNETIKKTKEAAAQLITMQSQNEQLSNALKQSQKNEAELNNKVSELNGQLRTANKFLKDLDNTKDLNTALQTNVNELNAQLADKTDKLKAAEKAKQDVDELYKSVSETLESERNSHKKVLDSEQNKSREVNQLRVKVNELTAKVNELSSKNAQTSADKAEDESTQLEQTESTSSGNDNASTDSKNINELKKWVSRLTKKLGATQNENKSLLAKNIELESKNAELTTQLKHWKAPPIHQNYLPQNLFSFPPPPISTGAVQNPVYPNAQVQPPPAQSHTYKK